MSDDLLTRVREAKGYVDKSLSVLGYIIDHKKDDYLMKGLEAAEQAADDLSREVEVIRMNLLVAIGEIDYREIYDPEHTNIAEGIHADIPVIEKST
ncbi:hypothetical protein LCGC14_0442830 [marine sediment metagenome]|uniref:Uncharacterized protein n=1 Tax=marine sediment metagenome TaxID=412755 RepID=A0A0F9VU91_9ZZZZ